MAGDLWREIGDLLAELDAVIDGPALTSGSYLRRALAMKPLMIDPPFLGSIASPPNLPSPIVSIVLPTRNRASFVGAAITSVQNQTFTDWDLIVVDDGSADDTNLVVGEFLTDSRVRYVKQEFAGQAAARNVGLRGARGTFVSYIDSDNIWYPNFLRVAVAALATDAAVDCVYGALETEVHLNPPRTILFEEFDWERLLSANYIDLNTVVHRRTLSDTTGGFDEQLDRLVDWDFLLRLTRDGSTRRIPVLASRYGVVDDQRVTETRPFDRNHLAIRRKWPSHPQAYAPGE